MNDILSVIRVKEDWRVEEKKRTTLFAAAVVCADVPFLAKIQNGPEKGWNWVICHSLDPQYSYFFVGFGFGMSFIKTLIYGGGSYLRLIQVKEDWRVEGKKKEPPSLPLQWFVPFQAEIQNGRMLNCMSPPLDSANFLS
ncbi:hypothetical protein CDAR_47141 [Caerostris darwini]|uniref:Uncharacterized protein n=1 Tax=Caerostris darwini TaxID=1538125 RepID=A0AAV4UAA3_9ARAC|nr:hypothetical protein CDAR_47141 [Caerostris darwini]